MITRALLGYSLFSLLHQTFPSCAQSKGFLLFALSGVFRDIDESGEGLITEDVLNRVLANPKVRAYFQTLLGISARREQARFFPFEHNYQLHNFGLLSACPHFAINAEARS